MTQISRLQYRGIILIAPQRASCHHIQQPHILRCDLKNQNKTILFTKISLWFFFPLLYVVKFWPVFLGNGNLDVFKKTLKYVKNYRDRICAVIIIILFFYIVQLSPRKKTHKSHIVGLNPAARYLGAHPLWCSLSYCFVIATFWNKSAVGTGNWKITCKYSVTPCYTTIFTQTPLNELMSKPPPPKKRY